MAGGITQFLIKHTGSNPVSFHMPGHKGSMLYQKLGYGDFLDHMMDIDITEIPGADNLFQAESIISQTEVKYRQLYGVKKTYLLINGTSGGLIAAILAVVNPGEKLILARNCHKSVFNAMILGGINPVYAYPREHERYGIAGSVTAAEIERLMSENSQAKAVVLPSPNYYGICSDIAGIAEVVHKHSGILIVDQAHGAHLKFMPGQPLSAEESGADIIVDSIHKTLASFTQSAVLHVNSDRVDLAVLSDMLQKIQSSSPSYILMASLDINAEIISQHGETLFAEWQRNLDEFYMEAASIPGLRIMQCANQICECSGMDRTKINLDMSGIGLSGMELEEELISRGIFCELTTGNILMCMTGIGNSHADYRRLLDALMDITRQYGAAGYVNMNDRETSARMSGREDSASPRIPWNKKRILHPVSGSKELVNINECCGRVCGASIVPYPPGIPLVCPGEILDDEDIEYIQMLRARNEKVIGVDAEGRIEVVIGT